MEPSSEAQRADKCRIRMRIVRDGVGDRFLGHGVAGVVQQVEQDVACGGAATAHQSASGLLAIGDRQRRAGDVLAEALQVAEGIDLRGGVGGLGDGCGHDGARDHGCRETNRVAARNPAHRPHSLPRQYVRCRCSKKLLAAQARLDQPYSPTPPESNSDLHQNQAPKGRSNQCLAERRPAGAFQRR